MVTTPPPPPPPPLQVKTFLVNNTPTPPKTVIIETQKYSSTKKLWTLVVPSSLGNDFVAFFSFVYIPANKLILVVIVVVRYFVIEWGCSTVILDVKGSV